MKREELRERNYRGVKYRGEGRREGVSLQQKRYETLLLTSTYNQTQAHAEYEIVSITIVPRLCKHIFSKQN